MDKEFNKRVFETLPDSFWTGEVPAAEKKPAFRYILQFAAVACAAFAAVVLVHNSVTGSREPAAAAVARSEIVYKVNDAVQASFTLPDSTRVTLNCGSVLRLAQDFGDGTRTVYLDGEGLFDVRKDRVNPFIINSPQGIEVCVTGTKFNMSCYSGNGKFDLTLLEGSVQVTTRKKEVLQVKPSEQILIKDEFLNISRKEEPEEAVEWTEGILGFDNTSLREALFKIEKWYGVDIVVEDEAVYRNSISAEFRSEPLDDVLKLICLTSHLKYTVNDKTVRIRSGK